MRCSALTALVGVLAAGEMREEDLRVRQVGRDSTRGERDHADARVLQLVAQQLGELALDLVGDASAADALREMRCVIRGVRASGSERRVLAYSVRDDFDDLEDLELVAFLDVVVVLQRQAALEAGLDLAHVVLEALERIELAGVDDHVVAQQAHLRAAAHHAVERP